MASNVNVLKEAKIQRQQVTILTDRCEQYDGKKIKTVNVFLENRNTNITDIYQVNFFYDVGSLGY